MEDIPEYQNKVQGMTNEQLINRLLAAQINVAQGDDVSQNQEMGWVLLEEVNARMAVPPSHDENPGDSN